MTRKDYRRIAEALVFARPRDTDSECLWDQWRCCVEAMDKALAEENKRFSSALFWKACHEGCERPE